MAAEGDLIPAGGDFIPAGGEACDNDDGELAARAKIRVAATKYRRRKKHVTGSDWR